MAENVRFVLDRIENIVGKGENAGYQYFLLLLECFQIASYLWSLKLVNVCKWVNLVYYQCFPIYFPIYLTLYHTMPSLRRKAFGNIAETGQNSAPFPPMFSTTQCLVLKALRRKAFKNISETGQNSAPFPTVFYPLKHKNYHSSCMCFEFVCVQNFIVW